MMRTGRVGYACACTAPAAASAASAVSTPKIVFNMSVSSFWYNYLNYLIILA
jgi:hypothetical protein